MAFSREAFIDQFLVELQENIQKVENATITLKKDPSNEDELLNVLRALHTMKGSSRMLKFNTIEKVAHGMENVYKGVKEKRYEITSKLIQLIFLGSDTLRKLTDIVQKTKDDQFDIEKLLDLFTKAHENETYDIKSFKVISEQATKKSKTKTAAEDQKSEIQKIDQEIEEKKPVISQTDSIRIKLQNVDELIKSINNLILKQFQLKRDYDLLKEVEYKTLELNGLCKLSGQQQNQTKLSNELLKNVQTVNKIMSEQITLIERDTFDLQESILNLRMLPLELITGSLHKMVEELSISLDKEIDFTLTGSDVQLDKMILENINDPIIHILRNAIDHGIESAQERKKSGKPKQAKISMACSSESGYIVIKIKDDGKGIDYENIRKKAIQINPEIESDIVKMSHAELNNFIFSSGFSTHQNVTELSGRGVGLDIVKHNIEKIKGKINIVSEKKKGTEFVLKIPLSLATIDGFFVSCSKHRFLIPSNYVNEVIMLDPAQKIKVLNKEAIKIRDKVIPIYYLSKILDKDHDELAEQPENQNLIIVESMGEQIGFIVDQIIEYTSLIYKPLPKNLRHLKVVQGIVFDEDFNIINIIHIPALIDKIRNLKNIEFKKRYSVSNINKHILVVDDSLNTREIEKSILEMENYQVDTAVDGIDGLEKLRSKEYQLVVTDIDMPRMNGLTLLENIKRDVNLKHIPVIIVSAFQNESYKAEGMKLGAYKYIIKAEFDRNNLIDAVKEVIG